MINCIDSQPMYNRDLVLCYDNIKLRNNLIKQHNNIKEKKK